MEPEPKKHQTNTQGARGNHCLGGVHAPRANAGAMAIASEMGFEVGCQRQEVKIADSNM